MLHRKSETTANMDAIYSMSSCKISRVKVKATIEHVNIATNAKNPVHDFRTHHSLCFMVIVFFLLMSEFSKVKFSKPKGT